MQAVVWPWFRRSCQPVPALARRVCEDDRPACRWLGWRRPVRAIWSSRPCGRRRKRISSFPLSCRHSNPASWVCQGKPRPAHCWTGMRRSLSWHYLRRIGRIMLCLMTIRLLRFCWQRRFSTGGSWTIAKWSLPAPEVHFGFGAINTPFGTFLHFAVDASRVMR